MYFYIFPDHTHNTALSKRVASRIPRNGSELYKAPVDISFPTFSFSALWSI